MRDWRAEVRRRLAPLRMPPEREAEIADEMAQHLEDLCERAIARGASEDAAERATLAELDAQDLVTQFAGVTPRVSQNPATLGASGGRRDSFLSTAWYDLRVTGRSLSRARALVVAVVLTLALGIGATTAIFSVVYGVLLQPLPYTNPDRIVSVYELTNRGVRNRLADPNFDDFRDQSRSFVAIASYATGTSSVVGASEATRTPVTAVSRGFFDVFRVHPAIGREFSETDARQGAPPTVIVSHGYWQQYLDGKTDLGSRTLKIDGVIHAVIGVMPAGFAFPSTAAMWTPVELWGRNSSRTSHNLSAVARLRDGTSVEQARTEISTIARRIHDASTEQGDYLLADGTVIPLHEVVTGRARTTLIALLGAVGFLLLVACGNVANLLLARASTKSRELAIRAALGAARSRLIRQFITEALLLSLCGGALGVAGAYAGVKGLIALAPSSVPRLNAISVNGPVLAFAFILAAAIAVGLGVFTALRATMTNLQFGLSAGGRAQAGSQRSQRVGRMIVGLQMASTMVLLVGAGLFGRSLMKALNVDPGFRVSDIVTMDVPLPWPTTPQQRDEVRLFYARLIDRLKQLPGVQNAGATSSVPTDGGFPNGQFLLMAPNEVPKDFSGFGNFGKQPERIGSADFGVATADYFKILGIPLVRGRLFDDRDGATAPHVALISESLARTRWPNLDPIGRTIEFGNMDGDLRILTIIGVVGDTHQYGLDSPSQPTVYVNLFQRPRASMRIAIQTDADSRSITNAARGVLKDLNPEIPPRFRLMTELLSQSLGSRKFNAMLVGCFGAAALLLAATGVFGTMAYTVNRRTKEIGVRVALGATRARVLRLILGQALITALAGVAIGGVAALALTRTLTSMLFDVTPTDPMTFGSVTALLIGVALAAGCVPARRASKLDPVEAIRDE